MAERQGAATGLGSGDAGRRDGAPRGKGGADTPVAIPGFRFGAECEVTLLDRDGTYTVRRISEQSFMKLYREMTAHFYTHLLKRVLR